jgi:hypothetical protein
LAMAGDATVRRVGTVSATSHFVIEDESLHVADLYAAWSAPLAKVYP